MAAILRPALLAERDSRPTVARDRNRKSFGFDRDPDAPVQTVLFGATADIQSTDTESQPVGR